MASHLVELVAASALLPACFHPNYDRPRCGPRGECPSGLACNTATQLCDGVGDVVGDAGDAGDAGVDGASLDGKLTPICLGTFVSVCVDPPQSMVTLATAIDTGSSNLCAPYTSTPAIDACVIAGQSIVISGGTTVTATGAKPLILLSTGSITISGLLDAASHQGLPSGPAGDAGPCPTTGFTNPTHGNQGGGGWGGSFGSPGGNGGNGFTGIGGIAPAAFTTTTLRGGCPGSAGADNGLRTGGGVSGHGGGAVALLAATMITIDGTVNASGGGGGGSAGGVNGDAGGGGGGSGGMVVLEAATVNVPGKCFANGGGGGEGGGTAAGSGGGDSTAPSSAGGGAANGSLAGGDGGAGAFGTRGSLRGSPGVRDGNDSGGGGAGGGGTGFVRVVAPDQLGTNDPNKVSPPPS